MIFLERLVEASDLGDRASVQQMRFGRVGLRPLLLEIVEVASASAGRLPGNSACALPSA
ncbi:hypothetical protein QA640_16445 [Bradyrhizobium sp. CB82]|uniref:hypothetical protein n=1 Tax=Bradyrhizobium sp. CB82 TaxID=3039159 RepID=UPI0024B1FCF1|nr:hypothetical protein [Bradyrhizobium sp. CB82]WFU43890.1 hypothetical protein QA640_16445 [Bradyrhizobium sp. CB82]